MGKRTSKANAKNEKDFFRGKLERCASALFLLLQQRRRTKEEEEEEEEEEEKCNCVIAPGGKGEEGREGKGCCQGQTRKRSSFYSSSFPLFHSRFLGKRRKVSEAMERYLFSPKVAAVILYEKAAFNVV